MASLWAGIKSFFAQRGVSVETALPEHQAADAPPIPEVKVAKIEVPPSVGHTLRPLTPHIGDALKGLPITGASLAQTINGPIGDSLTAYFESYPPTSIMGARSRATIFALIRMLRPQVAAEIGTYHAGGAEVMARALWENGAGFLHTGDPFNAERCEQLLATWPAELRNLVEFHPLNSMDFLLKLHHRGVALDFALVDGDHDYELALFDLQMAARLLRPGGIIVMNDSVQTGPFQATRAFLAANPAWHELGTAMTSFRADDPFAGSWASLPGTGLAVLQAPYYWSIGPLPRSWGQQKIGLPSVEGLSLHLCSQSTAGTLHYQAILRLFGDGSPKEIKRVGSIVLRVDGEARTINYRLPEPMAIEMPADSAGISCTFEIVLCWRPQSSRSPLALEEVPNPIATLSSLARP